MTIFEHIAEVLEQIKSAGTLTGEYLYVNKGNPSDTFKTFEEALERGLDLKKYEKREVLSATDEDFLEVLKGDRKEVINAKDMFQLERLYKFCKERSTVNNFPKKLKAINAKIHRNKDEAKDHKLRMERIFLYFHYGVVPQKSFSDMKLYKKMLEAMENKFATGEEAIVTEDDFK